MIGIAVGYRATDRFKVRNLASKSTTSGCQAPAGRVTIWLFNRIFRSAGWGAIRFS
jgi:hypothetical protein